MVSSRDQYSRTVVAGIGSPHGDDQAGWGVVNCLRQTSFPGLILYLSEPVELVEHLEGCQRLLVVDACQAGSSPGTIVRLRWPDERIGIQHDRSSHGIGVGHALCLAEQLGRLPPEVEVFGIQIADCSPGSAPCEEVHKAVLRLTDVLIEELGEAGHA